MIEDEKLPFTSHLEELRKRLITVFIAIGVGFVVSFGFKERLFTILVHPLIKVMKEGETLIYTGLPEAFYLFKSSLSHGADGGQSHHIVSVLDVCGAGII